MNDAVCNNRDAYLDDALAPGERARFARHLDDCPTCREAVDLERWMDGLLRSPAITQLEPPVSLVDSVRTSLARRKKFARSAAGGLAAAAAIAAVAIGWTFVLKLPATERMTAAVGTSGVSTSSVDDTVPPHPSSQFVADANFIAVPVASPAPNVTIVRVYPTYQSSEVAEFDSDQISVLPELDESAWTDSFNGG